jgi:hypothetical protein
MWSFTRPGVPTTTSTPRFKMPSWGPYGVPPYRHTVLRPVAWPMYSKSACTCDVICGRVIVREWPGCEEGHGGFVRKGGLKQGEGGSVQGITQHIYIWVQDERYRVVFTPVTRVDSCLPTLARIDTAQL